MTDPIKVKIQELCPDVKSKAHESKNGNLRCHNCGEPDSYDNRNTCNNGNESPITLAVVLRAIRKHDSEAMAEKAAGDLVFESRNSWDLEHDNYDQQSKECKAFIGSLLGVEK